MAPFLLFSDSLKIEVFTMSHPLRGVIFGVTVSAFAAGPALAADSDAEFVKQAASAGMMEVELGRHVSQHAADPQVRQFGQQMVTDHGKANQELKEVAQREGLSVPSSMQEEHREKVEELTKLRGRELDRAYMEEMVDDHDHDVETFREQAEEQQSDVDRWAATTVPTLEAHLARARSIEEDLGEEGPGNVGAGPGEREEGESRDTLDRSRTGGAGQP